MMRNTAKWYCLYVLLLLAATGCSQKSSFSVTHLHTEYLKNPWGVDVQRPRFTWQIKSIKRGTQQNAYQIVVATSQNLLTTQNANMWNSGKITSENFINIAYKGKPLKSNRTYYWKVHAWNQNNADMWSKTGMFHTGLFQQSGWKGSWISARDTTISTPLLRNEFSLKKPVQQATAFVTGVGYYILYLNGRKVGNHVLDPPMTNYHKRVLYASYDVTDRLQKGKNAVGIMLGNGAWRMKKLKNRYTRQNRSWGHHEQYFNLISGLKMVRKSRS